METYFNSVTISRWTANHRCGCCAAAPGWMRPIFASLGELAWRHRPIATTAAASEWRAYARTTKLGTRDGPAPVLARLLPRPMGDLTVSTRTQIRRSDYAHSQPPRAGRINTGERSRFTARCDG